MSLACLVCLILAVACSAFGQVPRTVSYQGRLTNDTGTPLDGTYSITFSLYDVATGGTALWSETKDIAVSQGLFSTALGDTAPFGNSVKFDNQYFLGVKVGDSSEMTPRQALQSAPYALALPYITAIDGNVGILTTNPRQTLDVSGRCIANGFSLRYDDPGIQTSFLLSAMPPNLSGSTDGWRILGRPSYDGGSGGRPDVTLLQWSNIYPTDTGSLLLMPQGGGVGIATSQPRATLDVGGSCIAANYQLRYGDPGISTGFVLDGLPGNISGATNGWRISGRPSYPSGSGDGPDVTLLQWDNAYPTNHGSLLIMPGGGNVGVGTITPSAKLSVAGGDIRLDSGFKLSFGGWTNGTQVWDDTNVNRTAICARANRLDIVSQDNSGQMVSFTPGEIRAQVGDKLSFGGWTHGTQVWDDTTEGRTAICARANRLDVVNQDNGAQIASFTPGNLSVGSLTLTSSKRFKEDVQPIESPLDLVSKLQGVSYNWDEEHGGKRDMGFIAEDVAKVLPELVTMEADGKNAVGMDYTHLIALAIEGIKAQQEEIEALKARIKTLEQAAAK